MGVISNVIAYDIESWDIWLGSQEDWDDNTERPLDDVESSSIR